MKISQIRAPLIRRNYCEMNVDVAVSLLRRCYHPDQLFDCAINLGLRLPTLQVASTFNPFGHIRVPEEIVGSGHMFGGSL